MVSNRVDKLRGKVGLIERTGLQKEESQNWRNLSEESTLCM